MSSAKSLTWDWMSWGRSFMYSKRRSGPRTEPCGTPELTGTSSEDSPREQLPGFDPPRMTYPRQCITPNAMLGKFKKQFEVVDLVKSVVKVR